MTDSLIDSNEFPRKYVYDHVRSAKNGTRKKYDFSNDVCTNKKLICETLQFTKVKCLVDQCKCLTEKQNSLICKCLLNYKPCLIVHKPCMRNNHVSCDGHNNDVSLTCKRLSDHDKCIIKNHALYDEYKNDTNLICRCLLQYEQCIKNSSASYEYYNFDDVNDNIKVRVTEIIVWIYMLM